MKFEDFTLKVGMPIVIGTALLVTIFVLGTYEKLYGYPETEWVKVGNVRCLMVDAYDRAYDANGDCWITIQAYKELQYK